MRRLETTCNLILYVAKNKGAKRADSTKEHGDYQRGSAGVICT